MIVRVWTLGTTREPLGPLVSVPCVTAQWGEIVRDLEPWPLVWGWTAPGQFEAAERYGAALVADVELKSWTGTPAEVPHADALAARVAGVTSHGYVAPSLRKVLAPFAARQRFAVPQIYDTDRSTPPTGAFARSCINSYRAAGFSTVIPLLGLSAGRERVAAWAAECVDLGCPEVHFWQRTQVAPWALEIAAALVSGGVVSQPAIDSAAATASPLWPLAALGVGLGIFAATRGRR